MFALVQADIGRDALVEGFRLKPAISGLFLRACAQANMPTHAKP